MKRCCVASSPSWTDSFNAGSAPWRVDCVAMLICMCVYCRSCMLSPDGEPRRHAPTQRMRNSRSPLHAQTPTLPVLASSLQSVLLAYVMTAEQAGFAIMKWATAATVLCMRQVSAVSSSSQVRPKHMDGVEQVTIARSPAQSVAHSPISQSLK